MPEIMANLGHRKHPGKYGRHKRKSRFIRHLRPDDSDDDWTPEELSAIIEQERVDEKVEFLHTE